MVYVKNVWKNGSSGQTPITDERLNHGETQYDEAVKYADEHFLPISGGAGSPFADLSTFGAKFDGVTDDSDAIVAAVASGRTLWWGGPERVYAVTKRVAVTLTADATWLGAGARIKVISSGMISQALNINPDKYSLKIVGLRIDGNRKTHTCLFISTSVATNASLVLEDVAVQDNYRASTAISGGDGMWISGGFSSVFIQRPRVERITMAIGAGISGSQGVAGITIKSSGAGMSPRSILIVAPYIDGVYSEDAAYGMDQDGIRVFTEEDITGQLTLFDTHFRVIGGQIRNCHGRSIKSQAEFGGIDGTKFIRDSSLVSQMAGVGIMPEIDFQVGGGLVSNVEARYDGAVPNRFILFSGTRLAGGKYSTGGDVHGAKLSIKPSSAAALPNFCQIAMFNQLRMQVNITDVEIVAPTYYVNGNLIESAGTSTDAELVVNIENVAAPMNAGNYVFYRRGSSPTPTYVSVSNVANNRSNRSASTAPTLAGGSSTTDLDVKSYGQLVRVVV